MTSNNRQFSQYTNASPTMSTSPTSSTNDNGSPEKTVDLNDFLDFLNMSCHVNDMLSQSGERQKESPAVNRSNTAVAGSKTKAHAPYTPVDFRFLSTNRLVNEILGYKPPKTQPLQDESHENLSASSTSGIGATAVVADAKQSCTRTSTITTFSLSGFRQTATNAKPDGGLHPKLNDKLDYILNEGILDAVLPFISPIPLPPDFNNRLRRKLKEPPTKVSSIQEADSELEAIASTSKESITKSTSMTTTTSTIFTGPVKTVAVTNSNLSGGNAPKKEPEVIIHVCDEVKNTSKDFLCPQSLLVSKMGYFADVTAGQKLEDMDISVHCDIQIFDWLMKWVKSDESNSMHVAPSLCCNNVVPILVSASFLQMEPLLLDCLSFCHSHLGEVVKASTNLSCLNDSIITRMAAMFTNVELEMVRDKKDRLIPRLWTKLIQSLFEPEPEALRGHYYSLAGLFRCSKCNQCLTHTMKSYVQCVQGNVRLNRWGQLISHHVKDHTWDVNSYITQLFKEFKSWRRVYWKLWGHAHYLYCCLCEMYFPVNQMSWCRYHPESPTFLGPVSEGRTTGPAGRYACCGQQAFRYETLPGPNGCQFREHSVLVETDRERSILSIVQLATEGCDLGDNPPVKLIEVMTNGELEPRWLVLSLMPQRCRQGLLPVLNPDDSHIRVARRVRPASSKFFADSSSEAESTDTMDNIRTTSRKFGLGEYDSSFSTSSSDGCESSGSKAINPKNSYKKKKQRKSKLPLNPGRYWSGELSARSNQDHQREFEEKVMKQVIDLVQKKTGSDASLSKQSRPMGGVYVKLEQEWREQLKQRYYTFGCSSSNLQLNSSNNTSATSMALKGSRKKISDNTNGQ